MGIEVFKGQTTNIESDPVVVKASSMIQVLISGVLDGADVVTSMIDLEGNAAPIRELSWQTSLGDTLTAPPKGDGGVSVINTSSIKFSITNAGASTDINFSYSVKDV